VIEWRNKKRIVAKSRMSIRLRKVRNIKYARNGE